MRAYVLLTKHVFLPVMPQAAANWRQRTRVSRMMQAIGRPYVGLQCALPASPVPVGGPVQIRSGRQCHLSAHLLPMHRVQPGPGRAGMIADPGDYPWPSYRRNALGAHDPRITPHRNYLVLACDPTNGKTPTAHCFARHSTSRWTMRPHAPGQSLAQ